MRIIRRIKKRILSRIGIDLSDGFEKRFRFRSNFRRIGLILSNGLHREFLWSAVNRRLQPPLCECYASAFGAFGGRSTAPSRSGCARPHPYPSRMSTHFGSLKLRRNPRPRNVRRAVPEHWDGHETAGTLARARPAGGGGRTAFSSTCCTKYTSYLRSRENQPWKRRKPSDGKIAFQIPRRFERTPAGDSARLPVEDPSGVAIFFGRKKDVWRFRNAFLLEIYGPNAFRARDLLLFHPYGAGSLSENSPMVVVRPGCCGVSKRKRRADARDVDRTAARCSRCA